MRKLGVIFIVCCCFFILNIKNVKGSTVIEDEIIYSYQDTFDDFLLLKDDLFLVNKIDGSYLLYHDQLIKINIDKYDFGIWFNNHLYVGYNYKNNCVIYVYDESFKLTNKKEFNGYTLNSALIIDDDIVCGGSTGEDAGIIRLNNKLEIIGEYRFGGDHKEEVKKIYYCGDFILLDIYKDALSNDSIIDSTGNIGEKRSVIVKLDKDYNYISCFFFDINKNDERIIDMEWYDERIVILVESCGVKYLYDIDYDFEINKRMVVDEDSIDLLINLKAYDKYLIIYDDGTINYGNKVMDNIYDIEMDKLYYTCIDNGVLYIYYEYNQTFMVKRFSEYELVSNPIVTYTEDLMVSPEYFLDVRSFFERFNFKIKKGYDINSFKESGIHDIIYTTERLDGSVLNINGKVNIKMYTNFIDGGIYPVGKSIKFFGKAYINGNIYYNSTVLNVPGEYLIELCNTDGIKPYHIKIVSDYYYDDSDIKMDGGINIILGDSYLLNYVLDRDYLVTNIHGSGDFDYYQDGNNLNIKIKENNWGSYTYYIDYIEYLDPVTLLQNKKYINEFIQLNFLKKLPNIMIDKMIDDDGIYLNLDIIDNEHCFTSLVIDYFKDEELVKSVTCFNNCNLLDNIDFNHLKINYVYNNGYKAKNEEILDFLVNDGKIVGDVNFRYDLDNLKSIDITVKPSSIKNVENLEVNKVNIGSYLKNENHSYKMPSIIITTIIIIVSCLIVVIKSFINLRNKF